MDHLSFLRNTCRVPVTLVKTYNNTDEMISLLITIVMGEYHALAILNHMKERAQNIMASTMPV